jgi:hypothetical protein
MEEYFGKLFSVPNITRRELKNEQLCPKQAAVPKTSTCAKKGLAAPA